MPALDYLGIDSQSAMPEATVGDEAYIDPCGTARQAAPIGEAKAMSRSNAMIR